jgi:hypothetical protein
MLRNRGTNKNNVTPPILVSNAEYFRVSVRERERERYGKRKKEKKIEREGKREK